MFKNTFSAKSSNIQLVDNMTPEYIDELNTRIETQKQKQSELNSEKNEKTKILRKFSVFNVPYVYDHKPAGTLALFSDNFDEDWKMYKHMLHSRWKGEERCNTLISKTTEYILYVMMHLVALALIIINFSTGFTKQLGIGKFMAIWVIYFHMEIICGIASTWYYLIRPNIMNNIKLKKEIKALNAEVNLIESDIKSSEGLIEAYKLSKMSPIKTYTAVKERSIEQLEDILNQAISETTKTDNFISKKYLDILHKCEELLDMARINGSIVTEISKIYTIYIIEIGNIMSKHSDSDTNALVEMINNFGGYVDRKIEKFRGIEKMSLENDINALNKAFLEE